MAQIYNFFLQVIAIHLYVYIQAEPSAVHKAAPCLENKKKWRTKPEHLSATQPIQKILKRSISYSTLWLVISLHVDFMHIPYIMHSECVHVSQALVAPTWRCSFSQLSILSSHAQHSCCTPFNFQQKTDLSVKFPESSFTSLPSLTSK